MCQKELKRYDHDFVIDDTFIPLILIRNDTVFYLSYGKLTKGKKVHCIGAPLYENS